MLTSRSGEGDEVLPTQYILQERGNVYHCLEVPVESIPSCAFHSITVRWKHDKVAVAASLSCLFFKATTMMNSAKKQLFFYIYTAVHAQHSELPCHKALEKNQHPTVLCICWLQS